MKLNQRFMCRRIVLGLTREEFAEAVGVSESAVSDFEDGKEIDTSDIRIMNKWWTDYLAGLDKENTLILTLLTQLTELTCQTRYEQRRTMAYVVKNVGKLSVELMKSDKEGSE